MFRRSAFALALLVLGGGDAASAVSFTAPFEKTLAAGLATLAQDLQALPKLQPAVVGVPLDVAGWAALSQDEVFAKLTLLSTQKADAVQYLMMDAPASRAQVDIFMADSNQLILAFADAIEAGECVTATDPEALKGGAAPPSSGDASAAPVAAAPSGVSAPTGFTPAPGSTPAPAPAGGAAPSKPASGPAAPASAPAQPSKVAGGSGGAGVAASPASGAVSVQGTKTTSKSASGTATGVATGVSTAGSTPSAAAAATASTPASTNSTGVSAVSLSIAMDGNTTDSSSNSDAAVGANGSVDANSAKSTPVQALTPTAGSASLAVSTAAAATVILAACALAV